MAAWATVDSIGCAYILTRGEVCRAQRRPASPYCEVHHALCHLAPGSSGERSELLKIEALATAVGGRRAGAQFGPSARVLRQLESRSR